MIETMTSGFLSMGPAFAGLLLAVSTAALSSLAAEPAPDRPPNIIFMLADDLGYGDLSCYNPNAGGEVPNNTPIRTPTLDRMARNGTRLTDFHSAAPLCSPSRRALLSARYASRLGEWAEAYRGSPDGMVAAREPTIGMWLKQAGYATACYGKWNVGEVKDVSWPGAHGFDDWLIIDHNTGYFQHQNKNKDCQGREMLFGTGGKRVTTLRGKYLTDIWTDKALEFIDANAAKPFFLYLPFAVPHSPLQDPADPSLAFDEQPKAATPAAREAFVKMVEYLDSRIAKIFQALEKRGLTDNTLVMFTSDNGGMRSGNCWPLKKQKQWLEEGGIRVPCLMQWPGVIPPGTVSAQASIMMDASVTMLAAGDALKHVPPGRKLDGIDLLPILQGKAKPIPDRVLGWRRRDWSANFNSLRQEAFRSGDWKLLRTYKHAGDNKRSAEHTDELFNLADDVSEAKDLAGEYPEKLATMQTAFVRWQQEIVKQNPDYLIPVPDQLGSPAKYPPLSMLFDFKRDRLDGKLLTRNNEARISEPVIQDGVFKARLSPGLAHPTPLLYRDGAMATTVFATMRVRMRVTVEDGGDCGPARALLRHDQWQGKDIPFEVHADSEWHEYVIDVTQSPAWRQWTPSGRIGMVMPEPDRSPVTVEIDFIKLETPRKEASAAPAPRTAKQPSDDVLVGVNYFAGWWKELPNKWHGQGWNADQPDWRPEFPDRVPLLGQYNDQATMDREIVAAAGHGVDFFAVLWYFPNPGSRQEKYAPLLNKGLETYLASDNASLMRFFIEYCNSPDFSASGEEEWAACVATWVDAMKHPAYLRVDGRLVFKVHGITQFLRANDNDLDLCRQRLDTLRDAVRNAGLGEMIIGVGISGQTPPLGAKWPPAELFDFTGTYMCVPEIEGREADYPYATLAEQARATLRDRVSDPLPWMPYLTAGWNPRPWTHPGAAPHYHRFFEFPTREEFKEELNEMKEAFVKYPSLGLPRKDGTRQKIFTIYAWNEFGEGGIVAPTKGRGTMMLESIRSVFGTPR